MAKLPPGISHQASPIQSALAEGRAEDAKRMIVDLLRQGNADRVVQAIAADLIKPPKRKPGRQKALPQFWFEIAEEFDSLRDGGASYEDALTKTAQKFGYSETHVRNCLRVFDEAKQASDGENRE